MLPALTSECLEKAEAVPDSAARLGRSWTAGCVAEGRSKEQASASQGSCKSKSCGRSRSGRSKASTIVRVKPRQVVLSMQRLGLIFSMVTCCSKVPWDAACIREHNDFTAGPDGLTDTF